MPACGSITAARSARICRRSTRRATRPATIVNGLGHAVHLEHRVAAPWRHREAHGRRPDDAARELRAIQSGRADRRDRPVPSRRDAGHDDQQFDPATGGYTPLVSVVDPKINLQLDPHTRAPRTDEYSVGVDREIGRGLAAAVAYVRKSGANFIGWTDIARSVSRRRRGRCPTAERARSSC